MRDIRRRQRENCGCLSARRRGGEKEGVLSGGSGVGDSVGGGGQEIGIIQ